MTEKELKDAPLKQGIISGFKNILGDPDKTVPRRFGVNGLTDDKELKKGFKEVVSKLLLLGDSAKDVESRLNQFGAVLTGEDLGLFFNQLEARAKIVENQGAIFEERLRGEMEGMTLEQKEQFLAPLSKDPDKLGKKASDLKVTTAAFKLPQIELQQRLSNISGDLNKEYEKGQTLQLEAIERRKETLLEIFDIEQDIASEKAKALTTEEISVKKRKAFLQQDPLFGEGSVAGIRRKAEIAGLSKREEFFEINKLKRTQQQGILSEAKNRARKIMEARRASDPTFTADALSDELGMIDSSDDLGHVKSLLNEEEKNAIDVLIAKNKVILDQRKEELGITDDLLSKEQKIVNLIEEKGAFGAGFAMGFGDIPDAESSAYDMAKTIGNASKDFAYNIGNAMVDAIAKGESLGDALLGAATSFLNIMSKALMEDAVNNILRGTGGSDGIGEFFGSLFKQGGGPIRGGSGTRDDVPAMLMGGEFVMNKKAVSKYGMGFMSAINNGAVQGFANGGIAMPGFQGAGAITGKEDLMRFATQSNDPGLGGLTMFGRRNSKLQQRYQGAKEQAFGLAVGQMRAEQQAEEQAKSNKKAFKNALIGVAISAGINKLSGLFGQSNVPAEVNTEGFTPSGRMISERVGSGVTMPPMGAAIRNKRELKNIFSAPSATNTNLIEELGDPVFFDGPGLLPSINRATGGSIPNTAGVDTVPTMLSGGEFVMNAAATQRIGAGNLAAANSGVSGGDSSAGLESKMEELIKATQESGKAGDINITVNGSNGQDDVQTGEGSSRERREFAEKIKTVVKQVITDEKRLGGQLRK